jgi:hypothetical protein
VNRDQVLKVLIGVRERRRRALEDAVRAAQAQEQLAQSEAQAAQRALVDAVTAESRERDKMQALTAVGQTFDIHLLMLREHVVATQKEQVVQQQSQVEQRDAVLLQRRQDVSTRRNARTRNGQKIDSLQGNLKRWRDERQRDEDDLQDEDAEETAIARIVKDRADPAEPAPTS